MVGASSVEEGFSRPWEVVVVGLPFLAWVVGVLSWPLEVEEVEPFCPLVVAEGVVVVVSSP